MPPFSLGDSASMKFLRIIAWSIRAFLFLALLLFAMKNADPVRVRFVFDLAWETPLSLLLLATLVIGAVLGLIASLPRVFAQRREIAQLKSTLTKQSSAQEPVPPADAAT